MKVPKKALYDLLTPLMNFKPRAACSTYSFGSYKTIIGRKIYAMMNGIFFPVGCRNYKSLSDSDREKDYNRAQVKCDNRLPKAWYRFTGAAGRQMPTRVVPRNHCGTHAPGWLSGGHPTVAQGIVTRRVCFHWTRSSCQWSRIIRVQNCGAFFVYELQPTPTCRLRYCGDDLRASGRLLEF